MTHIAWDMEEFPDCFSRLNRPKIHVMDFYTLHIGFQIIWIKEPNETFDVSVFYWQKTHFSPFVLHIWKCITIIHNMTYSTYRREVHAVRALLFYSRFLPILPLSFKITSLVSYNCPQTSELIDQGECKYIDHTNPHGTHDISNKRTAQQCVL